MKAAEIFAVLVDKVIGSDSFTHNFDVEGNTILDFQVSTFDDVNCFLYINNEPELDLSGSAENWLGKHRDTLKAICEVFEV